MPLHHNTNIEKQIRDLQKFFNQDAPRIVGMEAKNFFKSSFNKQGFDDGGVKPWKERTTRDKNRRTRSILIKTARLKKSIQYKPTGRGKVFVFSADVPYAKIHNEGGTIQGIHKVRSHTRRTQRGGRTEVKAHKRNVNTKIPKRQFMGNSKTLNRRIEKELYRRINKILNNV